MSPTDVLQLLAGPVVGAAIGVFTNYIAVKMLFRPRRARHIGRFRVPFTPGIIPRRKAALARAVGEAVSSSLVRREDLRRALLSDEAVSAVSDALLALPSLRAAGEDLLNSHATSAPAPAVDADSDPIPDSAAGSGNLYGTGREALLDVLADRVLRAMRAMDVGGMIAEEARHAVEGYAARSPLVGLFLRDGVLNALAAPLAQKVDEFLDAGGREKLRGALSDELARLEDASIGDFLREREDLRGLLLTLYRGLVERHADVLLAPLHIDRMVEDKINAMPAEELERLVLSVMRRELNAVIWLGGIIGFVLGILTTVVSRLG